MAEDWRGFSVPGWAVKRVDLWRFLDCCPMSMPEFGAALNREAEATEGRKVLLGYSMGGRLALHALLTGGPWDAAVIVSAHPGLDDEDERVARRARDAEWGAMALSGEWGEFLAAWSGQGVLKVNDRDGQATVGLGDRRLLIQRRQAVARSFMDWSLGVQEPLWDRFGEIECPLLWGVGDKDEKFRSLGEQVVAGMGRGRNGRSEGGCRGRNAPSPFELWMAEGAGHRVPWERPEAFAGMVGEFLERADS